MGAAFEADDALTAGAALTAVGGALLLSSIPLWVLWPGNAERVDTMPAGGMTPGIAVDGITPWVVLPAGSERVPTAGGLALRAHWVGW